MSETPAPVPELPASKAPAEDERSVLLGYLDYHRAVLARKVSGVTETQARLAACPPSDLTLLGIIRHMADVERFWFRERLAGEEVVAIYASEDDPEADFQFDDQATLADALESWRAEITRADTNLAAVDIGSYEANPAGGQPVSTVRRVLVHLIEEYARHCGHADLIRQAIDGATGD